MTASFGDRAVKQFGAVALLLGWRPNEFWAATPAELAAVLGALSDGFEAPDRHELERLRAQFPDKKHG